MSDNATPDKSQRQVSRWIAYPALAIFPLASIALGLRLGDLRVGEQFMIASMESTPAENWVMALLAVCIAVLAYVSWAYGNRTLRCSALSVAFVIGYVVVLFLFGVWGLYGLVAAWSIWFAVFWLRNRHLFGQGGDPDDNDT